MNAKAKAEISKAFSRLNKINAVLRKMPESVAISFASATAVFLEEGTLQENLEALHAIRESTGRRYKLERYSAYGPTKLTAAYRLVDTGVDIIMYFTDGERSLEALSGGKCTFQVKTETPKPYTSTTVACNL